MLLACCCKVAVTPTCQARTSRGGGPAHLLLKRCCNVLLMVTDNTLPNSKASLSTG